MSTARLFSIVCLLLAQSLAPAQGTAENYQSAASIRQRFNNRVLNPTLQSVWSADGKELRYSLRQPDGSLENFVVELASGKLSKSKDPVTPERKRPARRSSDRGSFPAPKAVSPDEHWEVVFNEHNVYVRDRATKEDAPFSFEGTEKEPFRGDVYWSPDSKKFVAFRHRAGGDRRVTLVESSPRDQVQPKLMSYNYLKPGDAIPQRFPVMFHIDGALKLASADSRLDSAARRDDRLFNNPWSINHCHWSPLSDRFTFLYNARGHQTMRVIAIDAGSRKKSILIDEECKTFFDYSNKTYFRHLPDDTCLWMSERSGWNHIDRIDSRTGEVKNAVTKGEWVVAGVDHIDDKKQQIWLRVMGYDKSEDPYHVHHARVNLDGSNFTLLDEGNGTHDLQWAPQRDFFIDTYSRIDAPPVHVLRDADGKKILDLATADITALKETDWQAPEPFALPGRDGKTLIYGYIVRPTHFDPKKKYPVIESIYAGPHSNFCVKRFTPTFYESPMAELGFIVIKMDGMGTNWRSKAFHDVCWQNLADSGFPDRIAVINALAKTHPEMDLSRGVGIYGGSAGGQSTLAGLLHHGDFYTVGVADCGCHDNRMDKIWWNEAWMGWPVGPHYAEQSNVTNAHKLTGKLMLVVGEKDNNVDPASTMQVANALIKANKDFDLLVMPGVGHGAAEGPYASRRRADFFVRHLMGVEPRR